MNLIMAQTNKTYIKIIFRFHFRQKSAFSRSRTSDFLGRYHPDLNKDDR